MRIRRTGALFAALLAISTFPLKAHSAALVSLLQIGATPAPTLATAIAPDNPQILYISQQDGRVRRIVGGVYDPTVVLDISDHVSYGGDQGLLGITFNPDGDKFYVDYAHNQVTYVDEYSYLRGTIAVASRRNVINFAHGGLGDHWGGAIAFGKDKYLYISTGDGGCCGDPHNQGQDLNTLLGKMLRIDPNGSPYKIPPDNPFINQPGKKPEIWWYGLRNPYRWTFDSVTGSIWLGDVGQDAWEEVDAQPNGAGAGWNMGWPCWEGNHRYRQSCDPPNPIKPVYDYPHSVGCAVIGGYVYHGSAIPLLRNTYIYSDFCAGRPIALMHTNKATLTPVDLGVSLGLPSGWGQDSDGEMYVYSLYGQLYKIVPA